MMALYLIPFFEWPGAIPKLDGSLFQDRAMAAIGRKQKFKTNIAV
jgi:hypothetical protein